MNLNYTYKKQINYRFCKFNFSIDKIDYIFSKHYSLLGNLHVLLRLVGGKELWKSMCAASSLCLENMILIIDIFSYIFANLEFTYCVSTMGNLIALGFVILKFGDVVVLK